MPGPVWRWVSNSSGIRLGVPSEVVDSGETMSDAAKVDAASHPLDEHMKPKPPAICNVSGCWGPRKYRLVRDFEKGACGMDHLRVLTGAM
jgi:Ino eighty subunit 2